MADTEVTYNWVDVKDRFNDACSELRLGELVHDNMFGLFEAMSAIEIMDPKMDAGMVCNRKRKVLQFQEAVQAGKVKLKDFSPSELLGIMDELKACFVTWLDGHSLVQSLFICYYCHDPYIVEDVVLKSLCIAMLKMVEIIRSNVTKAKVFEEEDFQPMNYGFKLASDITELRVSGMLREAEDDVTRRMKGCARENADQSSDTDLECYKAIKSRLKFWRSFYCGLLSLEKQECSEVSKALEHLEAAKCTLKEVHSTLHLGVKADYEQEYYVHGFDPLVNQRLLPPSFPRQSEICNRDLAMNYIEGLLERMTHVCSVTKCTTFHQILEFLSDFSRKVPCVLSRSILQLMVFHNNRVFGKYQLQDMVKESIKLFNSSPAVADLTPLVSPEAKNITNQFIVKASRAMESLIQAYGHNRARQREKFAALMETMGNLQEQADHADQELDKMIKAIDAKKQHLACFESWVLYHSLTMMIQHILLGFELELFNPHEFHYVYWYLDYLFGWANNCLARAMTLLQDQKTYSEKKCSKKDKKKKKEISTACQDMMKEHKSLRILFTGMKEVCLGNIQAYEAFDKQGKIKHPEPFFANEKIRFEHRFQSFRYIDTHQSAEYMDYKQMTGNDHIQMTNTNEYVLKTIPNLFKAAMEHYQRSMEAFQLIGEVSDEGKTLLKVSKTNFVVMKLAASGHKSESQIQPNWDFSVHNYFPIIKLT